MQNYILFVLVIVVIPNIVLAQNVMSLTFHAGYQKGALRDELFSPLNYNKSGIKTKIDYKYRVNRSLYFINIGYENSDLITLAPANFKPKFHNAIAQIGYLHRIWQPSSSVTLMCGGNYAFDMSGIIYNIDSYSYIAAHSLQVVTQVDWIVNQKHSVSSSVSLNPMNYVARPPYNRIPEDFGEQSHSIIYYLFRELKKSKPAPIGKYTDINLSLTYSYNLSKCASLGVCYDFRVVNYNDYHHFSQFNNNILLSFGIKL